VKTSRERRLIEQIRRGWPVPDSGAVQSSLQLAERIMTAIAANGGAIGFDHYMQMALYEPGLGYYSGGATRFGAAGDFVTAPLISPLFSRTLARPCADCLAELDTPVILELGAGSGDMAADLLVELAALGRLPQRYLILEVSAALREQQSQTLQRKAPQFVERVEWLERLPERPIEGVLLANEIIDALPVQRFRLRAGVPQELAVGQQEGRFVWVERPAPAALRQAVEQIQAELGAPLADGYTSEYCAQTGPWLISLAAVLKRGVMLFIDYGYPRSEYYHPQRDMGTLVCHYRHRAHDDPLILPGLQDITAFVDFSAAAQAGMSAGLDVLGFAPQAQFLLGAGLLDLVQAEEATAPAGSPAGLLLAQQVKTLTLPGEMGERFKVLAFGRDFDAPLRGFSLSDQRFRL
jgi:SAM-dependent MidA family methyltransferase